MTLVQAKRRRGLLPAEVTGFVGRESELAQLAELLHGNSLPVTGRDRAGHDRPRLVTVTGLGGVGKTRLALRAAARAGRWYPDGTYFADLATVTTAPSLAVAVAEALDLDEGGSDAGSTVAGSADAGGSGTGGDLATVLRRLRDRRLLLVLDTCEHLIDGCAQLTATLLRGTAGVTVLATSRQPLDVPGEHILPLRPLPVPDPGARETAGSAVELFSQRAASVIADFTMTDELLPDVIALCQRLDGIPLAIELAALRLRALPLSEMGRMARAHDGQSRVLTGTRRTAVGRHQSVPRSIEWSLGLCSPAERAAWARLSIFAGGFDLAAAEAVCADEGLPQDQVTQAVIGLIDKSVLLREAPPEPSRYRLPGALRQAGADLLADTADGGAAVRARYLGHWTRAAEQFASHLMDDQLRQYQAMRREHANLHAALEHSLTLPAADQSAARLGCALFMYWVIRGQLREGRAWLDRIVDRYPGPVPQRARALAARAFLTAMAGDLPAARADAETSIALATQARDLAARARGYVALHRVQCWTGDLAASTVTASLGIPVIEQAGDLLGLVQVDIQSSLAYLATDPQACIDIATRGLRRLPPDELWATSYLLGQLVMARFRVGDYEAAAESASKALTMKIQLGDAVGIAHGLRVLGFLAGVQGRYERAAVLLGAAPTLWEHAGYHYTGVPLLEELHRRIAQAAIDSLGEARYEQLREAGAGQPLDEVIALALGSASQPRPELVPGTATTPPSSASPVPADAASAVPSVPPDAAPAASPAAPPGAGRRSALAASGAALPATGPLTGREVQIAQLVANGLTNKEIARRMAVSKRTVDAHVDHIFAKLGISSRVQLTLWLRDRIPRARPAQDRGRPLT